MNATDRASELGTAHGKAAAQAWFGDCPPRVQSMIRSHAGPLSDLVGDLVVDWLPAPDLTGDVDAFAELFGRSESDEESILVYEAAFTAAVETTVRSASDSDQATVREAVQS